MALGRLVGRCECGADITNEEAAVTDYEAYEAEIAALKADNERLKAAYGLRQLEWANAQANIASLTASLARLNEEYETAAWEAAQRHAASLATARSDALEAALVEADEFYNTVAAYVERLPLSARNDRYELGKMTAASLIGDGIRSLMPHRAPPGPMLPGNMNSDVPDSPEKSLPSTAHRGASTGHVHNYAMPIGNLGRTTAQMSEDMKRYWQRRDMRAIETP
jgi:hypothetical protein